MRSSLINVLVVGVLAIPTGALAGTCYLDDPTSLTPLTSPIQAGGAGNDFGASPTLCGHEVHGASCVLQVNVDSTGSAGSHCLTIGSGVTVEMQGHSITCATSTKCRTAINNVGSASGTSQVQMNDGIILGCWESGIHGTPFADVSNFLLDGAAIGSCAGSGDYGIGAASGLAARNVDDVVVRNFAQVCLVTASNSTVTYAVAHGCGTTGFQCGTGVSSATLDTIVAYDNGFNVKRDNSSGANCTLRNSVLHSSGTCDIANNSGSCSTSGWTFTGYNFISDTIMH